MNSSANVTTVPPSLTVGVPKRRTMSVGYEKSEEPIVISKVTTDIILKQDNPMELMALYWFYYQTAKWQKSDQPKATNSYAAKGLHVKPEKIARIKGDLIRLGLISNIVRTNALGKITGHYIKIHFFWTSIPVSTHPPNPCVGTGQANASEALILNSSKDNTSTPSDQKPEALTIKSNPNSEPKTPHSADPPSPIDPNKGWNQEVMTMWRVATGGYIDGWKLKMLKPIVVEHGKAVVIAALGAYLRSVTSPQFLSLARFAETFGTWKPVKAVSRKFVTREETFMSEQGMNREEFDEWDRKRKEGGK